jgi:hypothetical protein
MMHPRPTSEARRALYAYPVGKPHDAAALALAVHAPRISVRPRLAVGAGGMRLTEHELLTIVHGMVFGAAFLLVYTGALEGLWSLRPDGPSAPRLTGRPSRLHVAVCGMAVLAWLTVLSGLYVVYPLYRAEPPPGALLSQFPQSYLQADPTLATWDTFATSWKAHIACLCPILSTAVAAIVVRYGRDLAAQPQIRQALMVLLTLAFAMAGVAGGLGALVTRVAPLR